MPQPEPFGVLMRAYGVIFKWASVGGLLHEGRSDACAINVIMREVNYPWRSRFDSLLSNLSRVPSRLLSCVLS